MTKPLYFYNGTTFELIGPTTPQSPIAYQTSAPTAPATGDLWIDSDGDVDTYNRQLTRYYFVATAAQTTITGTDANGLTLAYVAGSEAVYVNGALQVRGQDYTATNGTSVVLSSALAVNDVVEIFAYTAFTVANAYTKSETDSLVGAAAGLKLLVPGSIAVGSGSGSVSASGTISLTASSSVSINDVFSASYDNYLVKITIKIVGGSGGDINLRMRVSGTDNSSANYNEQYFAADGASGSFSRTTGATVGNSMRVENNQQQSCELLLGSPFLTEPTQWEFKQVLNHTSPQTRIRSGFHNVSTSYTGFTLTAPSNMTGTVQVYGFKE